MFNTPLSQVAYEQVLDFCRIYAEGPRVEYKLAPSNIPKVVSSFANTVGGIWIIGIATDGANRALLPPEGFKRQGGLEEQIVQSAHSGIYPPITPTVRLFDIPDRPGRVLAVVKVMESIEAPHAIENSTRVWIRSASTTEPYDLAEIDRIDYLLERRREPERRREALIDKAAKRSAYNQVVPRVRVVVAPLYPRGVVLPHDTLYQRADDQERTGVHYLRDFRLVHESIMSSRLVSARNYHFELSVQGIALLETEAPIPGRVDDISFVYLGNLLSPLGRLLNTVIPFFRDCVTNLLIRYELFGWQEVGFLHADASTLMEPAEIAKMYGCIDSHVEVSVRAIAETLEDDRARLLTDIMRQALWAFNYRDPDLSSRVATAARAVRVL